MFSKVLMVIVIITLDCGEGLTHYQTILTLTFHKQALVFTCLQSKSFENSVGNGEIARNEKFLLFPRVFSALFENFQPFSLNLIVVFKLFEFGRV